MMRQTRASTMAARAVAAVTPSPRKKQKVNHAETTPPSKQVKRRTLFSIKDNACTTEEVKQLIHAFLPESSDTMSTHTLDGWCLIDGLKHCMQASNGILKDVIKKHGPPQYCLRYLQTGSTNTGGDHDDGYQSYRSLCRIVTSQQLAGSAATKIWERFLELVGASKDDTANLTPQAILSIVQNGNVEEDIRKPAGLSNAKVSSIIALSEAFMSGELSDDIIASASDLEASQKLQNVKGIGPWSVDMFLLFECHRKDIVPIGDLAFRNGTAKLWKVKGKGRNGALCPKKDKDLIESLHEPFSPYRSLSTYYMYKVVDEKK